MKLFLILFSFTLVNPSFSAESAHKAANNEWKNCKRNKDCALIHGCCGWDVANKKRASSFEKFQQEKCIALECKTVPNFDREPEAECVHNQCTLNGGP